MFGGRKVCAAGQVSLCVWPSCSLDPIETLSWVFIDWATVDAEAELLQLILLSVLCLTLVCAHETSVSCGGCFLVVVHLHFCGGCGEQESGAWMKLILTTFS